MTGAELALAASVFLACSVEAVEALTIVLAVGSTRGWRSALVGMAAAIVALACTVAALGPALTALPLAALRLAVGGLLLAFGLQWLRKAILRAAGLKALHDEDEEFAAATAAARAVPLSPHASAAHASHPALAASAVGGPEPAMPGALPGGGGRPRARGGALARGAGAIAAEIDGYAFAIAFKGVLLEGLEVAFIVLTFGANQGRVGLAALAALAAVAVVAAAGIAARAPLARVPENTMKLAVGILITSFGMFWSAEGAGASWPGSDAALLVLVPATALLSLTAAALLRRVYAPPAALASAAALAGPADEVAPGRRGLTPVPAGPGPAGTLTGAAARPARSGIAAMGASGEGP